MLRKSPRAFLSIIAFAGFSLLGGFQTATTFHQGCLQRAKDVPKLSALVPSLVCGKKLSYQKDLSKTLIHLGLVHIFVISGAHLVFLFQLGCRILSPSPVLILLMGYTLMVGAQPPALRAWLALWILHLSGRRSVTPGRLALAVMLTGLIVWDVTGSGLSMALSWTAVATLIWSSGQRKTLLPLVWLYLTLLPLLLGLQVPHPITIVVNFLLSPVVFFFLLPASLIAWLIPWTQEPVVWIWQAFLITANFLKPLIPAPHTSGQTVSGWMALGYSASLHLLLWIFHIYKVRRRCSEPAS